MNFEFKYRKFYRWIKTFFLYARNFSTWCWKKKRSCCSCSILSVKAPLTILNAVSVSSQTNELPSDQNSNEAAIESTVQNENASFAQIDTIVKVKGGGLIGQAEAIKLGLARAICSLTITDSMTSQDEVRKQLKDKGYLTQDSRVKERRKYGLKKARKATQYNKR